MGRYMQRQRLNEKDESSGVGGMINPPRIINKQLGCRRQAARRSLSIIFLLSLKKIRFHKLHR